jgi:lipopolysaccharide export LptBFGC system permease protein LptF
MSKVGNYIVGASVVAIMAGSPVEAEAHNNYGDDNTNDKDKVVYVEENLRDSLKNDNTIAWEMVANNEQELRNATSSNQTKEELKEELKEDS